MENSKEDVGKVWWIGALISLASGLMVILLFLFHADTKVFKIYLILTTLKVPLFDYCVLGVFIGMLIIPFGIKEGKGE